MTLTTETPTQARVPQVRTDPAGKPLAIRYDGRIWLVDPDTESQHRFGWDARWDTSCTAVLGSADLVSIEYWRVQARLGSNSTLRTFTLRREPLSSQWLLENVMDGG